jgi:hypothetical protein
VVNQNFHNVNNHHDILFVQLTKQFSYNFSFAHNFRASPSNFKQTLLHIKSSINQIIISAQNGHLRQHFLLSEEQTFQCDHEFGGGQCAGAESGHHELYK